MFPRAINVRHPLCLLFKACVLVPPHHHLNDQEEFRYSSGNVHLIGHSLGAHTAGEAGRRIPGIRRVTGGLLTKAQG